MNPRSGSPASNTLNINQQLGADLTVSAPVVSVKSTRAIVSDDVPVKYSRWGHVWRGMLQGVGMVGVLIAVIAFPLVGPIITGIVSKRPEPAELVFFTQILLAAALFSLFTHFALPMALIILASVVAAALVVGAVGGMIHGLTRDINGDDVSAPTVSSENSLEPTLANENTPLVKPAVTAEVRQSPVRQAPPPAAIAAIKSDEEQEELSREEQGQSPQSPIDGDTGHVPFDRSRFDDDITKFTMSF